jgi:poly(3-hydroxybutyrate) depolymerase
VDGVDDLQFTTYLVAHLQEEYCIDSNRLYASGKSNGAGFVDTLACSDHGDQFAAFAVAAAALYTDSGKDSCTKKRAILESHGLEDGTIPYHPNGEPGAGGPLPDIGEWVQ